MRHNHGKTAVKRREEKREMKAKIENFLLMNAGLALLSAGVYFFKMPNGFVTGGVSGIATLLGSLLPFLTPAAWMMVINVLLLFLGFLFLGRGTGIKTVYCSLGYSALTWLFEKWIPLSKPLTDQPFLELVYAILLTAIGSAILFHLSASSGGTDIIALILKKYSSLNVGKALLCTDFLVAVSSFWVFGVKAGLYSLLGLFAKAFLVDGVIESINSCKYFIVITKHPQPIEDYILKNLHHGCTINGVMGTYTGENKTMMHTVCKRIEAVHLQKKVYEIDPHAFTIITTTSEIIGRGFRSV